MKQKLFFLFYLIAICLNTSAQNNSYPYSDIFPKDLLDNYEWLRTNTEKYISQKESGLSAITLLDAYVVLDKPQETLKMLKIQI